MFRHDRNNRNHAGDVERLPFGIRLLHALRKDPDWEALTAAELAAHTEAANRLTGSRAARVITGFPERDTEIDWKEVALGDRVIPVRVYRPAGEGHGTRCRSWSTSTAAGSREQRPNAIGGTAISPRGCPP